MQRPPPMAETRLRLVVRGRVQGVGYRWAMVDEARRLGVAGWVRNRRDGSVEAVVAGPGALVEQLLAWAGRGPAAAEVESVERHADPATDELPGRFEPRPTV